MKMHIIYLRQKKQFVNLFQNNLEQTLIFAEKNILNHSLRNLFEKMLCLSNKDKGNVTLILEALNKIISFYCHNLSLNYWLSLKSRITF